MRTIAKSWLVTLLLVWGASAGQTDDSLPLFAKVTSVVGSARYLVMNHKYGKDKNQPNWTDLRAGDVLASNVVLQTNVRDSTADIEVRGSDEGGRATIRLLTDTVLRQIQLRSKKFESVQGRDILLDVGCGQIRIILDGVSAYAFTLISGNNSIRVTIPRGASRPEEAVFLFNGSLTVLKGSVQASVGSGPEKPVHAGEQLRRGADEVTRVPRDAPELKLVP